MPFIFGVLILVDDAPLAIMSWLIMDELGSGESMALFWCPFTRLHWFIGRAGTGNTNWLVSGENRL